MHTDIHPKTLLVLENVICQQVPLNVDVGDLYITDDGIAFISYTRVTKTKNIGYLAGGLGGELAASAGDSQGVKEGKKTAAVYRDEAYGLPIKERTHQYKNSFLINKANISRLDYNKKQKRLTFIGNDSSKLELIVPDLTKYQVSLEQFPSGQVLYDTDTDPHGILLGFPSPAAIVRMFTSGSDATEQIPESNLTAMAANDKYMFRLYSEMMKKDKDNQKSIIKAVTRKKPAFAASLSDSLIKGIKEEKRAIRGIILAGVLFGLIFGGIGIGLLLFATSDTVGKVLSMLFVAVPVVCVIFCSVAIRKTKRKIRQITELLSIIKPTI